MTSDLLPSPFCGGAPDPMVTIRFTACSSCGATARDADWNRRALPTPDDLRRLATAIAGGKVELRVTGLGPTAILNLRRIADAMDGGTDG